LPDGTPLAESNAILFYLAELSTSNGHKGRPVELFPEDLLARAQTMQWLFFEQYSHEPYIATNRFYLHILKDPNQFETQIATNRPKGYAALDVMEKHLDQAAFFSGSAYGIADIALYAYTHVAHEGGYDLAAYPRIGNWIEGVRCQPHHIGIGE
jgi:glutathione S-transferase